MRAAIVYASGYAEAGEQGAGKQRELEHFAKKTGMLICGPNCMGLANMNTRAITAFATLLKLSAEGAEHRPGHSKRQHERGDLRGRVQRGVRFSQFINTGNEACLEFAQFLDFLVDDEQTRAVIGYVKACAMACVSLMPRSGAARLESR